MQKWRPAPTRAPCAISVSLIEILKKYRKFLPQLRPGNRMNTDNAAAETAPKLRVRMPIAAKMAAVITALLVFGLGTLASLLVNHQQAQIRAHIEDFGQLITSQLAMTATEPMFTDEHYELAALVKRFADNPRIVGAVI